MKTGMAVGVIIVAGVVGFFLMHQKAVKRPDSSYAQIFSSLSKDFTCADGSFYSSSLDLKNEGVFNFYPTPESLKTVKGNATYGNPPWAVGIGGSANGDDLVINVSSDEGYTALLSSMAGCKNADGKSPVEVYKISRIGSGNMDKKNLPTEFRSADRAGDPHIVGMKTEHIAIPEACEGCNADIVQSMKGASIDAIIELNHALTGWIFSEDKDIRVPKNRKLASDVVHVDGLRSGIVYADSGIVTFFISVETDYAGAAHPNRDIGSYNTFVLSKDGKKFDRAVVLGDNESKVLEHFYPNGSKLLEEAAAQYEGCYEASDFPDKFHAQLRPGPDGEQVVFAVDFEYGRVVPCGGLVEIAIPIADIMREVPHYVPENSVLRILF